MYLNSKEDVIIDTNFSCWKLITSSRNITSGKLASNRLVFVPLTVKFAFWNIMLNIWGYSMLELCPVFNRSSRRKRGMGSNPKMEYQVFLCIFQKNYGYLRFEGNGKISLEKGLPHFSKTKLRQPTGHNFNPTFSKEFSHFLQT